MSALTNISNKSIKHLIFIRAEGSPSIGLGHLVRCLALAHMLKDDFIITFFCMEIPLQLAKEFVDSGFILKKINSEYEFLNALSLNHIAILDGYSFDTNYQRKVRKTGCKLVSIDDLHDQEFVADLIINHAPGITSQDYKVQPYTRFALGLDYALLRPAFLGQAKKERKIEKIETLLIAFGGADPKRLTEKTLEVALELDVFKRIIVVTGVAFEGNDRFLHLLSSDQRTEHRNSLSEKQMLKTMLESDLAILPASGILFEALAIGSMVISGYYTENQKLVYDNLKKDGLFFDAGNFNTQEIREAIKYALTNTRSKKTIIDGNSKERILKVFNEIQKESLISLRAAKNEDLELTYRWAINQEIRRFSFQQHQIAYPEHKAWFLGKISQLDCIYLIGEIDKKPFGSIRFDIKENDVIISYLVDPVFHGQALGLLLLKKGIEALMIKKDLKNKTICGFVMKTNLPSIKAFERLGFGKVEFDGKLKFFKKL